MKPKNKIQYNTITHSPIRKVEPKEKIASEIKTLILENTCYLYVNNSYPQI